mmetsp:Transcript_37733/g.106627  ORF Transcript_37733/g.106627 Transcript_37733/m.106627 type:complete len:100 (+) Transcript_37733:1565-1864(+)
MQGCRLLGAAEPSLPHPIVMTPLCIDNRINAAKLPPGTVAFLAILPGDEGSQQQRGCPGAYGRVASAVLTGNNLRVGGAIAWPGAADACAVASAGAVGE